MLPFQQRHQLHEHRERHPLHQLHLGFPIAERASEAATRRVRADLGHVADAIAKADPHARALVLTGGFSRGEGTVRDDAPVNDYDLVCIRSRPGGGALYRRLADRLTAELGLHIDLMPIWKPRLRVVGRKLFWLDLRLGGRVIAGDPMALAGLRAFPASALALDEAARLLGNRAAGLLLSLPPHDGPDDPQQRDLQATKAILAAMDASLIAQGQYEPRMRDRLALTKEHPDHALFATAVAWKLRGHADLPADYWDQAAQCLLRAVESTGARHVRDTATAHVFYALHARRFKLEPSRRVREAAWDLLAESKWPEGPANAAWVMASLGVAEPTWARVKPRFFALRAQTLQ